MTRHSTCQPDPRHRAARSRRCSRQDAPGPPWRPIIFLLLLATLSGCGARSNNYELGAAAMQRGRVDEALIWFERAVIYDPGNSAAHRDYGAALFMSGNALAAVRELEQARELGLNDGTTAFYLGLSYEGVGRKYDAVDAYAQYVRIGEFDDLRRPVEVRLRKLTREIVEDEVRLALAAEAAGGAAGPALDPDVIAVLPFRTLLEDEELAQLRTGLAALVASDLERIESLRVVDRLKVASIRSSLDLEHGTMVDSLGAPRAGRLLGAGRLVTGSLDAAGDQLQVEGAIASVSSGLVQWTDAVDEELDRFYQAQKRLVYAILTAMGIEPGADVRLAIDTSVPTRSLLALLAYSRGLELEDRGMRAAARAAFLDAMQLDPQFSQVIDGLRRLGLDDSIDNDDIITPGELAEREIGIRGRMQPGGATTGAATAAGVEAPGDEEPEPEAAAESVGDDVVSDVVSAVEDMNLDSALDELFGGTTDDVTSRLDRTAEAAQTGHTPSGDNDSREPAGDSPIGGDGLGFGTTTIDLQIDIPD